MYFRPDQVACKQSAMIVVRAGRRSYEYSMCSQGCSVLLLMVQAVRNRLTWSSSSTSRSSMTGEAVRRQKNSIYGRRSLGTPRSAEEVIAAQTVTLRITRCSMKLQIEAFLCTRDAGISGDLIDNMDKSDALCLSPWA